MLDRIVDASNPQEPVFLYCPGDDLLFAKYLDRFDQFVTEVLGAAYLRCLDNFALFADDPAGLDVWRGRLAAFLAPRRLSLHPVKTHVTVTSRRRPRELFGAGGVPGTAARRPGRWGLAIAASAASPPYLWGARMWGLVLDSNRCAFDERAVLAKLGWRTVKPFRWSCPRELAPPPHLPGGTALAPVGTGRRRKLVSAWRRRPWKALWLCYAREPGMTGFARWWIGRCVA